MRTRARALGHSIHPMLIVFPLGLLSTAVVFDIVYLITDRAGFNVAAAYAIAAGIVGGLIAAVFGLVDWLGIPGGTRAKRIGAVHGLGNVGVVLLFAISFLLRANDTAWHANAGAITFGILGVLLATFTGWLGGELVARLGVGVDEDAQVNAPSSLQTDLTRRGRAAGAH